MNSYTIRYDEFPASLNKLLRAHWSQRSRAKERWRVLTMKALQEAAAEKHTLVKRLLAYNTPRDITLKFYWPTKHRRDPDNYQKIILDALVRCGVIADDNYQMCHTTVQMLCDRDNPRLEIEVRERDD